MFMYNTHEIIGPKGGKTGKELTVVRLNGCRPQLRRGRRYVIIDPTNYFAASPYLPGGAALFCGRNEVKVRDPQEYDGFCCSKYVKNTVLSIT